MSYRVYRVKAADRARLDEALGDDILSRQSITLRDARHFGREEDALYLFIEGTDEALARADDILLYFAQHAPEAAQLHAHLKTEEDEAATSLGSIFDY